jgi:hypothetical protein
MSDSSAKLLNLPPRCLDAVTNGQLITITFLQYGSAITLSTHSIQVDNISCKDNSLSREVGNHNFMANTQVLYIFWSSFFNVNSMVMFAL